MSWIFFFVLAAILLFFVTFAIPFGVILAYSGITRSKVRTNKEFLDFQIQKKREEYELNKKHQPQQFRAENPFDDNNGGTSKKQ